MKRETREIVGWCRVMRGGGVDRVKRGYWGAVAGAGEGNNNRNGVWEGGLGRQVEDRLRAGRSRCWSCIGRE